MCSTSSNYNSPQHSLQAKLKKICIKAKEDCEIEIMVIITNNYTVLLFLKIKVFQPKKSKNLLISLYNPTINSPISILIIINLVVDLKMNDQS